MALGQRGIDGGDVMPVELEHPGTEGLGPSSVGGEVPRQLSGTALAEPVDVTSSSSEITPVAFNTE